MRRDQVSRQLAEVLAGRGPSLTLLEGLRGTGKSTLLRATLAGLPDGTRVVAHACLPLPDPDQRAAVARLLRTGEPADGDDPPPWASLLGTLAARLDRERRPLVIVLDDAHHALSVRHGVGPALEDVWSRARAHALPLHLVLSGPPPVLAEELERSAPDLRRAAGPELRLAPMAIADVAARVPAYAPPDRLRTWAVFGGVPDRVRHVDPGVSLATNVRRLLLEPTGALARAGLDALEGVVQSPARYASILRALAGGARDWKALRTACPDFETGSRMAPYVSRLEEVGLVEVRRSLDAQPGSRNRRYGLFDPFVAFWYRFVLPRWSDIVLGRGEDLWSRWVRPGLDAHLDLVLPGGCRDWLVERGERVLPERGRTVGALWGAEYDVPVAGILRNGAVVYGSCLAIGESPTAGHFDALRREIRDTRWGFGRESRHLALFSTAKPAAEAVRRTARDPLTHLVGLHDLVGGERVRP